MDPGPHSPSRGLGSPPCLGRPWDPGPEQRPALTLQRVREGARSGVWRERRPPLFRVPRGARGASGKVAAARAEAAWPPRSSRRRLGARRPRVRAARRSHFERDGNSVRSAAPAPSSRLLRYRLLGVCSGALDEFVKGSARGKWHGFEGLSVVFFIFLKIKNRPEEDRHVAS